MTEPTPDIIGAVTLTERDLAVIAAAMEIAFSSPEDMWIDQFTPDEVDECEGRLAFAREDAKTW